MMADPPRPARAAGFTMVELMVVVVIVAILAGVGIPSYFEFVQKSRRSAAKSTLLDVYTRQENFFADMKRYAANGSELGYPADTFYVDTDGDPEATQQDDSVYSISITRPNNFEYTITATAVGRQVKDSDCATLSITNTGLKTATSADCW